MWNHYCASTISPCFKTLALFTVLILIAVGSSGQAIRAANPKDQAQQAIVSYDEKPFDWHAAIKKPEWWLIPAAYLTLAFLFWQTWETHKSANAGLLSAQALANSERARITVAGGEMGHSVEFSAKNVGRVPAGITYARGFTSTLPYGEKLPPNPQYLDGRIHTEIEDWVSSGQSIELPTDQWPRLLADLSDNVVRDGIRNNKVTLWVYARICYRDGVSIEIRETRFCYSISIGDDGYPIFTRDGSPVYRIET